MRSTGPQKLTEPVALSSTVPVNLRLPPSALGSGFDLLALRARCTREDRERARQDQGTPAGVSRYLRRIPFSPSTAANRAVRSTGPRKNSPSRWRFRPPSPRTFGFRLRPPGAASTYSRSVLGARANLRAPTRPFKPSPPATAANCGQEIVHISTGFVDALGTTLWIEEGRAVSPPTRHNDHLRARLEETPTGRGLDRRTHGYVPLECRPRRRTSCS